MAKKDQAPTNESLKTSKEASWYSLEAISSFFANQVVSHEEERAQLIQALNIMRQERSSLSKEDRDALEDYLDMERDSFYGMTPAEQRMIWEENNLDPKKDTLEDLHIAIGITRIGKITRNLKEVAGMREALHKEDFSTVQKHFQKLYEDSLSTEFAMRKSPSVTKEEKVSVRGLVKTLKGFINTLAEA